MKKLISLIFIFSLPVLMYGQVIDNFETEPDTSYWDYDISANADPALSYVNVSYATDPVDEGSRALQLDYSAHNIESGGG